MFGGGAAKVIRVSGRKAREVRSVTGRRRSGWNVPGRSRRSGNSVPESSSRVYKCPILSRSVPGGEKHGTGNYFHYRISKFNPPNLFLNYTDNLFYMILKSAPNSIRL